MLRQTTRTNVTVNVTAIVPFFLPVTPIFLTLTLLTLTLALSINVTHSLLFTLIISNA